MKSSFEIGNHPFLLKFDKQSRREKAEVKKTEQEILF